MHVIILLKFMTHPMDHCDECRVHI